jgi:hypothetical protein
MTPYRASAYRGGELVEHLFSRLADARAWVNGSDQTRPWRIQARRGGRWQTVHQSWRR